MVLQVYKVDMEAGENLLQAHCSAFCGLILVLLLLLLLLLYEQREHRVTTKRHMDGGSVCRLLHLL
jgi:hypothetical protein